MRKKTSEAMEYGTQTPTQKSNPTHDDGEKTKSKGCQARNAFLHVWKQARKIRDMREEIKDLHGEAFRAYLLREFGAGNQREQFRRFSAAELVSFRQMLIDGCNQWLRDAGSGKR